MKFRSAHSVALLVLRASGWITTKVQPEPQTLGYPLRGVRLPRIRPCGY